MHPVWGIHRLEAHDLGAAFDCDAAPGCVHAGISRGESRIHREEDLNGVPRLEVPGEASVSGGLDRLGVAVDDDLGAVGPLWNSYRQRPGADAVSKNPHVDSSVPGIRGAGFQCHGTAVWERRPYDGRRVLMELNTGRVSGGDVAGEAGKGACQIRGTAGNAEPGGAQA